MNKGSSDYPGVFQNDRASDLRRKTHQDSKKEHSNYHGHQTSILQHSKKLLLGMGLLTFIVLPAITAASTRTPDICYNEFKPKRKRDEEDAEDVSFLLDSGAARHCCKNKHQFRNLVYGNFGNVQVGDGALVPIIGMGDVSVNVGGDMILLKNVLYVPQLQFNVISVKRLWKDNRLKTVFADRCYLKSVGSNKRSYFNHVATVICTK